MRRAAVLVAASAALACSCATAQTVEQIPQRTVGGRAVWAWSAGRPAGVLTLNLTRADVRIVRSDGDRVELRATSPDADGNGSPVDLVVSGGGDDVRIIDRYPPSPASRTRECLPPDGEHGGMWTYGDKLTVTLTVPRATRVRVATMAGSTTGS